MIGQTGANIFSFRFWLWRLVRIFYIAKRWKERNFPDALQGLDNEPNRPRGRSNSMDSWEALGGKLGDEGRHLTDMHRFFSCRTAKYRLHLTGCLKFGNYVTYTKTGICYYTQFWGKSKSIFRKVLFLITNKQIVTLELSRVTFYNSITMWILKKFGNIKKNTTI